MYFHYFVIITPCKKAGSFIWTNLNPLLHKDASCQDWLKLSQRFWRRRCFNFINVFSLFPNYLPLEKTWRILFTHGCFVPSLVEIMAQWFWRRRFYTFINAFSEFPNYLPLEKDKALHYKQALWFNLFLHFKKIFNLKQTSFCMCIQW